MNKLILWAALSLMAAPLFGQSADGRWVFDKAADFENISQPAPAPSSEVARSIWTV